MTRVWSACALFASVLLPFSLPAADSAPTEGTTPPAEAPTDENSPPTPSTEVKPVAERVSLQTIHGALELTTEQLADFGCDDALRTCKLPERTVAMEELLFVRFPWGDRPVEPQTVRLLLRSGDALVGRFERGDDETITLKVQSLGDKAVTAPLGDIKGWLRNEGRIAGRDEPVRAALHRQLERRVLTAAPADDVFVLLEGGEIRGLLEELREGSVLVSSDALNDSDSIEIPYDKLRAAILTEVDLDDEESDTRPDEGTMRTGPQTRLALRDGTRLHATLTRLAGGRLQVRHEQLGDLEIELAEVLDIAFLSGRARYLSDLDPIHTEESLGPAFLLTRTYRRDTNVLGGPLRLGQRTFEKGLGVHAYSRLHFRLGGEFERFQAVVGLDAAAHPRDPDVARTDVASVVFRVRVDDELSFEKAMTWRDEPLQIELPVAGREVLILEVDYGGPPGSTNFALDRADWADARVLKSRS